MTELFTGAYQKNQNGGMIQVAVNMNNHEEEKVLSLNKNTHSWS